MGHNLGVWIVAAKLDHMDLRRTRALLPNVEWRATSPSTNAELRELADRAVRAGAPLPHGTLLLTNAWGDLFPMTRFGEQYQYVGDGEMMVWTPSPELAAQMELAFGG